MEFNRRIDSILRKPINDRKRGDVKMKIPGLTKYFREDKRKRDRTLVGSWSNVPNDSYSRGKIFRPPGNRNVTLRRESVTSKTKVPVTRNTVKCREVPGSKSNRPLFDKSSVPISIIKS